MNKLKYCPRCLRAMSRREVNNFYEHTIKNVCGNCDYSIKEDNRK